MSLILILFFFASVELNGYDIIRFMRFYWGQLFFGSIAEMILYLYLLGLYSKIIESTKCACLYMNWTIYLNQSNIYFIYSLSL
jgi:hypothetical protein